MEQRRTLNEAGILVKRYLNERGRSQAWLTRELGKAQETLSKKLHGKLPMDRELIYAISRVLGLSDAELQTLMAAAGEERAASPSPSTAAMATPHYVPPAPPRTRGIARAAKRLRTALQETPGQRIDRMIKEAPRSSEYKKEVGETLIGVATLLLKHPHSSSHDREMLDNA